MAQDDRMLFRIVGTMKTLGTFESVMFSHFGNNWIQSKTPRTFEMINPTEDSPITIHLAAGTYLPETGESFPIDMVSNLNIEGEDEETTILDAMGTSRVITMEYCANNTISGITITGGLA